MLLISIPAIAAGILAKRLPETKDALLPETLEDAMMLDFRFAHKITHFSRRTLRAILALMEKQIGHSQFYENRTVSNGETQ